MDKNRITFFLQFFVALLAVACLAPLQTAGAQDPPRVIEISAKRFGFTPNQVTLKNGETVTLRLTSEDVTHGFFARPLKIDQEIEPGRTTELTVTPQAAGVYTVICHHFCGVNHGNMRMVITVTE